MHCSICYHNDIHNLNLKCSLSLNYIHDLFGALDVLKKVVTFNACLNYMIDEFKVNVNYR
jgi:hypothetical protein